jgi:2-oxoglutarate dehydrogenase E1 component
MDVPNSWNTGFVEELLVEYLRDPSTLDPQWRAYFDELSRKEGGLVEPAGPSFRPTTIFNPAGNGHAGGAPVIAPRDIELEARQDRVDQLIRAYRVRGHMAARLNPLAGPGPGYPELDPAHYGLTEADLDQPFSSRTMHGRSVRTLREILTTLRNAYCRYIGAQFMHIDDLEIRHWIQERMEDDEHRLRLSRREQFRILTRLTDAVIFEEFIQKKFLGAKSFSLEGAESLIPLLDLAIEQAGRHGIDEIVIGMAHRGRLNVLANIMDKSPRLIFREFEDLDAARTLGRGDVKYHLGYQTDWTTAGGHTVHLALCFNPSHLEYVNPVALGRMRAKQDRFNDQERRKGMALLIHGDAAFAAQGMVQEILNLSGVPGYSTGGTLHVVVNNQIGFTTPPEEGRSTQYCTDVAKMLQSPIFHVNGEYPEAVAQVVAMALEFRHAFQRDVFIDMYCYRRRGHNESDEPSFTQPLMYQAIQRRKNIRESYLDCLVELGGMTRESGDEIADGLRRHLEVELSGVNDPRPQTPPNTLIGQAWRGYRGGLDASVPDVDTGVEASRLQALLAAQAHVPEDFHVHPKIERLLEQRRRMASGAKPLDWAVAEALAFASLAADGVRVRLTGQDTARGTFSHRHAELHDHENGRKYVPLRHVAEGQAPVEIYNSPLSESSVLGFEYGFSMAYPDALVLWEAQFGDFINCAQVIVDQFLVSAEDKWQRLCGLVLLLPHGFEGQGPEHSSARMERFLNLAADDNIQVVNPTTPAQYFHVLRRQVVRKWRKPLVVMTPKSLLRHPRVASSMAELASGRFQRVIPDQAVDPQGVRTVLLCSGKVYYDLLAERERQERGDVAIVRIEQYYPLQDEHLQLALKPYRQGTSTIWVQEEPRNMGAWYYLHHRFGESLWGRFPLRCASRPASASPATGSPGSHKLEQERLVAEAFGG